MTGLRDDLKALLSGVERGDVSAEEALERFASLAFRDLGSRVSTSIAGSGSPLLAAGIGKEEVRRLAEELGLPSARKPASACLASRIPYGTAVEPGNACAVRQPFRSGPLNASFTRRLRVCSSPASGLQ